MSAEEAPAAAGGGSAAAGGADATGDCAGGAASSSTLRRQLDEDLRLAKYFKMRAKIVELFKKDGAASFQKRDPAASPFVGLVNQGATCYLNALLQSLFVMPRFRGLVLALGFQPSVLQNADEQAISVPCVEPRRFAQYQLQTLFGRLCLSQRQAVSTRALTTSFGNFNSFEQHDAQELCRKLFEHLDDLQQQLKDDDAAAAEAGAGGGGGGGDKSVAEAAPAQLSIDDIFGGTAVNYLESCDGAHSRQVPEKFLDLELDVEGCASLDESLRQFVTPAVLEGDNQWQVEVEGSKVKVDARKGCRIRELPPVLMLHLKRFTFDFTTMRRRKIRTSLSFPARLDMAPYLDEKGHRGEPCLYDLCAITVHKGTAMGGHYIAFGRSNVGIEANTSAEAEAGATDATDADSGVPIPAAGSDGVGPGDGDNAAGMHRDSHWVCFNDANVHVLSRNEARKLFVAAAGEKVVAAAPAAPVPADAATSAAAEVNNPAAVAAGAAPSTTATPTPPEGAQSAATAPLPPAAKSSSNTDDDDVLGSTYDVDKDAYLLIYRRRETPTPADGAAAAPTPAAATASDGEQAKPIRTATAAALEASVPAAVTKRMKPEMDLERLLLDVCSVHSSILELDVVFQVPRVEATSDGLFKLSYEPIKQRLLFHEKTTLRNVLQDVVANVQGQLTAYFAASPPGGEGGEGRGVAGAPDPVIWATKHLCDPAFWRLDRDDGLDPPFRLRSFDAATQRGTTTFGVAVPHYDTVTLASLGLPRTASLQLELVWQQDHLAAELVSHGARRAAPATADRLLDLFQLAPLSESNPAGAAWVEYQPDAMWLVLCAWDFGAKSTRPLCDVLVPGQKKATLGGLVAAAKDAIAGRSTITELAAADDAAAAGDVLEDCSAGAFDCEGGRWQLLALQKGRARRLRGPADTDLRRAFELWPTHEVVLERLPASGTSGGGGRGGGGVGAASSAGGSDSAAPFAGVLGDAAPGTSVVLAPEAAARGDGGDATPASEDEGMGGDASKNADATGPRPSVAEAFEASQNYIKVFFNDPFEATNNGGASDVDFCHFVTVDGREAIATLRHKIAAVLMKRHPEEAFEANPPDEEGGADAAAAAVGGGDAGDDDAEAKEGEDGDLAAAQAFPIHLRRHERADMIKDERKAVSLLGIVSGGIIFVSRGVPLPPNHFLVQFVADAPRVAKSTTESPAEKNDAPQADDDAGGAGAEKPAAASTKKRKKFSNFADKLNATLQQKNGAPLSRWNQLFELPVSAGSKVRQVKRVLFERLLAHNASCESNRRVVASSARHLRLRCIEQGGSRGKILRDDDSMRKSLGRLMKDGCDRSDRSDRSVFVPGVLTRCVVHMEPLDIPESITKKEMVLVLRHWQPVFRASVLAPPLEIVVPKTYTTAQLLNEHLKPTVSTAVSNGAGAAANTNVGTDASAASNAANAAGAAAPAGPDGGGGGGAAAAAPPAVAAAAAGPAVGSDADFEVAKWSEFFGNLNGGARTKTIRKLTFAGIATMYEPEQMLTAPPVSYREGCILVWRLASDQRKVIAAKAAFDLANPDAAKKTKARTGAAGRRKPAAYSERRDQFISRQAARPESGVRMLSEAEKRESLQASRKNRGADADDPTAEFKSQFAALKEMGFATEGEANINKILKALRSANGDIERAMPYLFD